jgi:hypothetical protein
MPYGVTQQQKVLEVMLESIPEAMRKEPRWVVWKGDKVPHQGHDHTRQASSTKQITWCTFEIARQVYEAGACSGIGFVLGDGWAGIDLDKCLDSEDLHPEAASILQDLDSYAEVSPSGTGVKAFIRYQGAPTKGIQGNPVGFERIELYSTGRYFTVTGHRLDEYNDEPQERTSQFDALVKRYGSNKSFTPVHTNGTTDVIIHDGERDNRLTSEAGVLRRRGYSEDEILTTLHMLNAKWCKPPVEDEQVVKIARSVSRYDPAYVPRVIPIPEEEMEPAPKDAHPHPGEMPKELLQPGGILQEVIDRTVSTAIYPQPAGALSMSLTLIGALAARKYATQTDLRTNLYTVFIAKSGTGKEHPRAVAKELLHGGLKAFLGAESFASDSAVISQLNQHQAKLFMLDELGKLMKAVLDPRSGAHLTNISKTFLELFSKANQIYRPKAYADSKNDVLLECPACCIYGTTTPSTIFEAMTPDNLSEGLVGRFLFFEAPEQRPKRQARNIATEAPADDLRKKLEKLESMDLCRHDTGVAVVVPDTLEASQLIEAYRDQCEHESDNAQGDAYRAVWNRAAEHAYKVALIHALSAGEYAKPEGEQVIEAASMEYGIQLADYCTRLLLHLAEANIAENDIDRGRKILLDFIKRAGMDGVTGTDMANSRAGRKLGSKGRNDALQDLIEQGRVRFQANQNGKGARYIAR